MHFSFEFFPPRNQEASEKLRTVRAQLATLKPEFCSVTFGAGGTTQEGTLSTVLEIQQEGLQAAPHLSCITSTKEEVLALLNKYKENGIKRIVALRGDIPSGFQGHGDFRYANELVTFIREQTGDSFILEVAAYPEMHPQASNYIKDVENFKRKVDAGANSAITQYFYNVEAYFYFIEMAQKMGVTIPIIPGVMPIMNYTQLARFSDACGADIPRWIRKRLEAFGEDKAALKAFGLEVTTKLCEDLIKGGAPGLHFYSMNQAEPTMHIWNNLNLSQYQ